MCGIAGIVDLGGRQPFDRELLNRMNDLQGHRGPDESGLYLEPGVGLAHKRLSIIDLSSGQQPLWNEDGTVVIVYNGEIYNFPELTEELLSLGHTFKSHCDTEVIVHGWEEWGEKCVDRFRGMFAFALWDRIKQTLFMARDRLGVKPLYYAVLPDKKVAFASELKGLVPIPGWSRELDPHAIEEYFAFGYVPEPKTIFKGALKLEPGHTITFTRGEVPGQPRQYWDAPFAQIGNITEADACEELIERLREAVKIRMIADVPLGAFLSGGLDSSAVVAMMARLSPDPVNTCSIAFSDSEFDESKYASRVGEMYGTRHHVDLVDVNDFGLVDSLAGVYDEPFADSSAIPTYRVCELARKRVTVALSGDGGDENFAGYRRYRLFMGEERFRNVMPLGLRTPLFGFLGAVYPKADWAPRVLRAKTTFQALARDSVAGYFDGVSLIREGERKKLFSDGFRRELQSYDAVEVLRRHAARSPTRDPLSLIQYLDLKTYLVGDILTKVDRASMANSLEVRVPLLDHKLVEWISGLPANWKLRGGSGKYIFKKAIREYLPSEILHRRKMGFAVPLASWFRGPLRQTVREAVLGPRLRESGLFNADSLLALVDQHQSGSRDHSAALWSLLMFEKFQRNTEGVKSDRETSSVMTSI
jgi:asparagine synthase (glutamine-hydrolysing)